MPKYPLPCRKVYIHIQILNDPDSALVSGYFNLIIERIPENDPIYKYRSSHRLCSMRKGVLKNFAKLTRKHRSYLKWKRAVTGGN